MTPIATVFRTIKKINIKYVLTGLAVLAPFLHLLAKPAQPGILHWAWMSSFLNALGWALLAFFIGIVIIIEARHKHQRLRGILVTSIGIYYIIYIFFPNGKNFDFTPTTYYIALGVISLLITSITVWWVRFDKSQIHFYRYIIQKFITLTHSETEKQNWIKEESINEFKKQRFEIANELVENE